MKKEKKAILSQRMQTVARIFVYVFLFIFLFRNTVDLIKDIASVGAEQEQTPKTEIVKIVPDDAQHVAKIFVEKWFFVSPDPNFDAEKHKNEIRALMSNQGESRAKNVIGIAPPEQPTPPATNDDQQQNKEKEAPAFQGLSVKHLNVWNAAFTTASEQSAKVTLRADLSDDRVLYIAVPVIKANGSWLVDGPPSLVPNPNLDPNVKLNTIATELDSEQREAAESRVDAFMRAWLSRDLEVVKQFADGKTLDSEHNVLASLNADKTGIINIGDFEVVANNKNNPLIMSTRVQIKDKNGYTMSFYYQLSLKLVDDQWIVESINPTGIPLEQ